MPTHEPGPDAGALQGSNGPLQGAGIGLRAPHYEEILGGRNDVPWLEVHSENFFFDGGASLDLIDAVVARYPLSLHGVGLSLGSAEGVSGAHLRKLRRLVDRLKPVLVSDHLSWSAEGGRVWNDLLPLPFSAEAVQALARNIDAVQQTLGRRILVENVSSYLVLPGGEMPERDFVNAVIERADCGLLLDVNNIFVSATNNGFDALDYLSAMPAAAIGEIHLAGHSLRDGLLIDTHSTQVAGPVWTLYADAIRRFGAIPTLIEWDSEIPALDTLLAEARTAQRVLASAESPCIETAREAGKYAAAA